jgi:hypothetical protein
LGYFGPVIGQKGERMSFGRIGGVLGLLLAAAVLAGCGGTVLDSTAIEEQVDAYVENSLHESVKSVDCPSGEPVDPGLIIKCDVSLKDGGKKVASVEITNKDADFRIARYGGSNE